MAKGSIINVEKLRNKVKDSIDYFVSKARDKDMEKVRVALGDISEKMGRPVSTLRAHATNRFLQRKYDSVTWKPYKGLHDEKNCDCEFRCRGLEKGEGKIRKRFERSKRISKA